MSTLLPTLGFGESTMLSVAAAALHAERVAIEVGRAFDWCHRMIRG